MEVCPPSTASPQSRRISTRRRSPLSSLSGRLVASASLLAISSSSLSSGLCGRSGGEACALLERRAGIKNFAWIVVGRGLRPEGGVGWQGGLERLAIERGRGGRLLQPGSLSGNPRVGSSDRPALAQGTTRPGHVWPEATPVAKATRSVALSMAPRGDSLGGMHGADGLEGRLISADDEGDEEIPSGQQFNDWFASALLDTEVGSTYPLEAAQAAAAVAAWRERMPPQVFARVARGKRLVKEIGEALPILRLAADYVASLPVPSQGEPSAKATIIDLCSGFGYLAMLLSDCLPHDRIEEIVLVDKSFPMPSVKPQQHHISTDHLLCHGPIPLRTMRCNVKKEGGGEAEKLTREVKEAPGPVLILAIHLCGTLSIRAVNLFNINPEATFLALKPCCLPHTTFVGKDRGDKWELGGYTFKASPVVVRGRYKGGRWAGEERSALANKFKSWVKCLSLGVDVGAEGDKSVMQIKMHRDFEQHYQTAYIVASREYGVGGDNNVIGKQRAEAARISEAMAHITRILAILDDLQARSDDSNDVTETCLKLLGMNHDDLTRQCDEMGNEIQGTPLERCRLQYKRVADKIHPKEGGEGVPDSSRAFGALRDAFRSLVEPLGGESKQEWQQPWERLLAGGERWTPAYKTNGGQGS